MTRILKYRLPPVGHVGLGMHGDPRVLAIGWQGPQLVLWAEVDEDAPRRVHVFEIALTGDPVPHGAYIGSAQQDDAGQAYVVHVYRQGER